MKTLDIWPAFPLVVYGDVPDTSSVDNVVAQLEHTGDRISRIDLHFSVTLRIEKLWTALQVQFPKLKVLALTFRGLPGPVLPDSLLGGSAPHLRFLSLVSVSFPALPKILLSATRLVYLHLWSIPHSGYCDFSPKAVVASLHMLTSLESFELGFSSPRSYLDRENRRSPLPTRSILPALTTFQFQGGIKYLEDFVSRIDAPRLDTLSITFFYDIGIFLDTPELNQFINRTPISGAYDEARFVFNKYGARVRLLSHHGSSDRQADIPTQRNERMVDVYLLQSRSDWQLLCLMQISITLSLRLLSTMESLFIYDNPLTPPDDIENTTSDWSNLLLIFTAVKNLYLADKVAPRIAPALQELTGGSGGRIDEVFPALQNIFLEGFQSSEPVQEGIAQLISALQLNNHPVAISVWDRGSSAWNFC